MAISYASEGVHVAILDWSQRTGINGAEHLAMHVHELFSAEAFDVLSAQPHSGFLLVRLLVDKWQEPKEFGLLDDGRLSWTGNT